MKMLLCHNFYINRGGESEVFENEVRGLRQMGHEVVVYARRNEEIADWSAVKKVELLFSAYHSSRTYQDLRALISSYKPDIAIVQNVFPLISPSIYGALRDGGVPTIQAVYNYRLVCPSAELYTEGRICERCVRGNTVHAVLHKCYRDSYFQSAWYASIIGFHRAHRTFSDRLASFMVPDDFLGRKLAEGGIDSSKIWRNPNPFFVADYRPVSRQAGFVLYVGRLIPQKGLLTLMEAIHRSAVASRLVVVGEGPLKGRLQNQIDAWDLGQRITLVEPRWGTDLNRLVEQCTAVVIPSEWYDSLPLILCQANATGKPVIVSRLNGMPEYVREGVNGSLFEPGNAEELGGRIDSLLHLSESEYGLLSAKARAYAEDSLDYQIHYANLMSTALRLVGHT